MKKFKYYASLLLVLCLCITSLNHGTAVKASDERITLTVLGQYNVKNLEEFDVGTMADLKIKANSTLRILKGGTLTLNEGCTITGTNESSRIENYGAAAAGVDSCNGFEAKTTYHWDVASKTWVKAGSSTPTVTDAVIEKSSFVQKQVNFTLTNEPLLEGTWKIYSNASGSAAPSGVRVEATGNSLMIEHSTDVPEGDYYVAVTEYGKAESGRLQLTIKGITINAIPNAVYTVSALAPSTENTNNQIHYNKSTGEITVGAKTERGIKRYTESAENYDAVAEILDQNGLLEGDVFTLNNHKISNITIVTRTKASTELLLPSYTGKLTIEGGNKASNKTVVTGVSGSAIIEVTAGFVDLRRVYNSRITIEDGTVTMNSNTNGFTAKGFSLYEWVEVNPGTSSGSAIISTPQTGTAYDTSIRVEIPYYAFYYPTTETASIYGYSSKKQYNINIAGDGRSYTVRAVENAKSVMKGQNVKVSVKEKNAVQKK